MCKEAQDVVGCKICSINYKTKCHWYLGLFHLCKYHNYYRISSQILDMKFLALCYYIDHLLQRNYHTLNISKYWPVITVCTPVPQVYSIFLFQLKCFVYLTIFMTVLNIAKWKREKRVYASLCIVNYFVGYYDLFYVLL